MANVYMDKNGNKHMAKLVNVIMPQELIDAIDDARGQIARADWIRDACLEKIPKKNRPDVTMRRPGNPRAPAVSVR
jgi:hypothetical protein